MDEEAPDQPTGYLLTILHKGITLALSHLNTHGLLRPHYEQAQHGMQSAPDGSFIISQNRKPSSSQNTNFGISLLDPVAYALFAMLDSPIQLHLNTHITIRGQHHLH
jgi:hypothetical protein